MKKGIDVSKYNGTIDFAQVKSSGIEFVIIRLGWIGNKNNHTIDTKFEENYKNAKAQGLAVGCYVYSYVENSEAMENAISWIKEKLKGKTFDYPLFLDVEDNQISNIDKTTLTNLCKQFCNSFTNYVTGIYANKHWFENKLNVNELTNYKIWLAEWNNQNMHTAKFKVDMWQYSSIGKVNGIVGNVDMNYCLNCDENGEITGEIIGGDEEVKTYQNGSTREDVFSDTNLTNKIGYLNPRESCDCFGIFNNRAMVRYKVDNSNNYKIGFCKWLGGVKQ